MSNIKLKAWKRDEQRMLSADELIDILLYGSNTIDRGAITISLCNDENIILLRYTGLKDSAGVEIYEGDIVSTTEDSGQLFVNIVEYRKLMASFVLSSSSDERAEYMAISDHLMHGSHFEAIGNIYENPDLLNG